MNLIDLAKFGYPRCTWYLIINTKTSHQSIQICFLPSGFDRTHLAIKGCHIYGFKV